VCVCVRARARGMYMGVRLVACISKRACTRALACDTTCACMRVRAYIRTKGSYWSVGVSNLTCSLLS